MSYPSKYSSVSSHIRTKSYSLIIKVRDFSNETVHIPGKQVQLKDLPIINGESPVPFRLHLYANGMTSDDKGYVSAEYKVTEPVMKNHYNYYEVTCVFSVIDASENKRFPQSYVFPFHPEWCTDGNKIFPKFRGNPFESYSSHMDPDNWLSDLCFDDQNSPMLTFDEILNGYSFLMDPTKCDPPAFFDGETYPTFTVDQILKRDLLLSDQDDLLNGDCLRLHVDVGIRIIDYERALDPFWEQMVMESFDSDESGPDFCLNLDTELAERLAEVSPYFQRMSESQMVETKTRCMKIPESEYPFFRDVCGIIMGVKGISVESFSHVCEMYIVADKYDIPMAIESCRNLLTTLLRIEHDPVIAKHVDETVPTILELAETYNDVRLKENVESYLKKDSEDGRKERRAQKSSRSHVETEWELERFGDESSCSFTFKRDFEEKPVLHFYH